MKTQKCLSILSLAASGLLIGASQALASPLLDSDLASYTVLGSSSESSIPRSAGESALGGSGTVQAIVALNASVASTGLANPTTESQRGVGAAVMQLAQSLHSAGIRIPGREALARLSSSNELAAETGSPTRDNRDSARRYLCAMARSQLPGTAIDPEAPDLCDDIPTSNDFPSVAATTGNGVNPALIQSSTPGNRNTGALAEDLQQALLLASLPVDLESNPDGAGGQSTGKSILSSSPDIATTFAAFPSALVLDELAVTLPEPAVLALLVLGLAGIGYSRKRIAIPLRK